MHAATMHNMDASFMYRETLYTVRMFPFSQFVIDFTRRKVVKMRKKV